MFQPAEMGQTHVIGGAVPQVRGGLSRPPFRWQTIRGKYVFAASEDGASPPSFAPASTASLLDPQTKELHLTWTVIANTLQGVVAGDRWLEAIRRTATVHDNSATAMTGPSPAGQSPTSISQDLACRDWCKPLQLRAVTPVPLPSRRPRISSPPARNAARNYIAVNSAPTLSLPPASSA